MPYEADDYLSRHFQTSGTDLARKVDELAALAAPGDSPNLALYREMLFTVTRMAQADRNRWDAKIMLQTLREMEHAFSVLEQFKRRRKVTVFGSARTPVEHPVYALARKLGEELARYDLMVITGAGGGIMAATLLSFAERGASLLAADLDLEAAERSAELARALGATAHVYQVDVGDTQTMETFAEWVRDTLGVPDVVVSNAGIGMAGPMLDTSPAEWERLLRVNLWSVIDGCRLFGRQMIAANKPGHLVNVASGVAFAPSRNYPAYATSKAAVLMLSECLRAELAGRSIGVTAVCPGFVDTGIVQATRFVGMDAERQARRQAKIQRFYKRRRLSPDTVGEKLVRAVERNKAVVSVGSEVHLGALQWRFAPWATRFLARFDLTS
ncbi:hypothetical protein ALP65_00003 [Pseudomonas aeruginosa]|uniref:SDR family NAD(P)-dependent oxidoreductase n=2 Tax=Gammaproteobacteria TaxID=1236 RepID=A0A3M5EQU8_PSEAI|nr:hypothetical protein ALP65_00003 [Pseudomonas aeruginosa]